MLHQLLGQLAAKPRRDDQARSMGAVAAGESVRVRHRQRRCLFVRHTFLNQFAKLLAYASLAQHLPREDALLGDIITGDAFHRFGVSNIGEIDFFAL